MTEHNAKKTFYEDSFESGDSVALAVNHLWRAKWLLIGVFLVALLGIFVLSQLIPDRFGVKAAYLPPAEGKVNSLLSEPLIDRDGDEKFVFDVNSMLQIFTNAAQSNSVKRKLYEAFAAKSGQSDDLSFSAFLSSVQFTPPETGQGDPAEILAPAQFSVFAGDPELALWLGESYQALAEENAIETLKSDFESLKDSMATALRQSADKLREDYSFESQQTLAALRERQALLEGVIQLRRSGAENDARSEVSIVLDTQKPDLAIPIYLLSDSTLMSALDVVKRQMEQINARENPDLYISGLANIKSRIKAVNNVELEVSGDSFHTEFLSPTLDEKLQSPKRFFFAVVGAVILTIMAMIGVLLAPMVRAKH